jgi:hippurate hydrolase
MTSPNPESSAAALADIYRDLHANPELSFAEVRTARIASTWLRDRGFDVFEGIGRTGVAGVLRRGDGPVVMIRADMDALPVLEATGLAYASTATGTTPDGATTPVMHACGHDLHVTCLMGAAAQLADDDDWSGTVVAVFQPAEEIGAGARAMVDDQLFDEVPVPQVVIGQHVAPLPAGTIGLRSGPAFAATDSLRITLHGKGGHGSRPEACIDPIVMAAAVVMRLQALVAREVAAAETVVLTVGALNAGSKANIVPEHAELLVNLRTYDDAIRTSVLEGITRVVNAEATASGAARLPDVELIETSPAVINDPTGVERTRPALEALVGAERVVDPGPLTGSEDVGILATAAGAPCVFWLLGGADPAAFASAVTVEDIQRITASLPSNHAPTYAPVIDPTLQIGVDALVRVAKAWLG